ncbi:MAG TPA: HAD hydrolase-like protein [Patescibacteria group bacterium]|nr:HAD hydrolase-like protein [Patescibacteria group bacterium]
MRAVIFDLDHTIFATETVLRDGAKELLAILQRLGIAVGGISSADVRILARLDEVGIRKHFDMVLCSDQVPVPKEVAGVQRMLYLLGAQAEDSIFVSHAHSDILLGKDAGLQRTIGVSHGKDGGTPLIEAGADRIVGNLPAVLDVLE